MSGTPWNKGKKMSPDYYARHQAAMKVARVKKKLELLLRTCNIDPTHKPYLKKNGSPTWFVDLNDSSKFVCGLCHYDQTKTLKFKNKDDLKEFRSTFMSKNNPMHDPEIANQISKQKSGVPTGPVHSKAWLQELSKNWKGNKNPNFGGHVSHKQARITIPHIKMEIILEELGIDYNSEIIGIPGEPDTMIGGWLIIFTDGDYYHCNPNIYLKGNQIKYPQPPDRIINKKTGQTVQDKRDYDRKITQLLRDQGYTVLRFWEHQLETSLDYIMYKILNTIRTHGGRYHVL